MIFIFILSFNLTAKKDSVKNFAEYLEKNGDYEFAILEYERYLFLSPENRDKIFSKITYLYLKTENFQNALNFLNKIKTRESKEYNAVAGYFFYKLNRITLAKKFWSFNDTLYAYLTLLEGNKEKAESILNEKIKFPRFPSKLIATILSIFLPGAGKIYSGRLYDGIYSFLINSISIYSTYYFYKKRDFKRFYITLPVALFFYSGNVFGSYYSAKMEEKIKKKKFFDMYKKKMKIKDILEKCLSF